MAKTFAEALLRELIAAAEDREAARLKEKESEAAKDGWIPLSELLKKVSATYAEKCAAQRDTQEVGAQEVGMADTVQKVTERTKAELEAAYAKEIAAWSPLKDVLKRAAEKYAARCAQAGVGLDGKSVVIETGKDDTPKPDYKNNPFVCILVGDEPSYGNIPDLMIAVKKGHAEHDPFDLPPGTRVAVARIVGFIDKPDVPQPVFAPLRDL